jgi:DNA-binding NtrC family response regulator
VRGAFTGAANPRGGLFVGADRGTLFLDEVGEASPPLQIAFLACWKRPTITPVGADRPRKVDVRIVSATNQNLAALVREGRFRRDLYYRLNVFPVPLPPLRDRSEDIVPLATRFLRHASRRLGREPAVISREARAALQAHPWEGNVRELRSVMERAALVCRGGLVKVVDLPLAADDEDTQQPAAGAAQPAPNASTLRDMERQILLRTLGARRRQPEPGRADLGLHESTLRFRLRRAGIAATKRAATS